MRFCCGLAWGGLGWVEFLETQAQARPAASQDPKTGAIAEPLHVDLGPTPLCPLDVVERAAKVVSVWTRL